MSLQCLDSASSEKGSKKFGRSPADYFKKKSSKKGSIICTIWHYKVQVNNSTRCNKVKMSKSSHSHYCYRLCRGTKFSVWSSYTNRAMRKHASNERAASPPKMTPKTTAKRVLLCLLFIEAEGASNEPQWMLSIGPHSLEFPM